MSPLPSLTPTDPDQLDAMHQQLLRESQQEAFIEAVQEVCGTALENADAHPGGALDLLLTAVGTLANSMGQDQRARAAAVFRSFADHMEKL
jgi:hypothetical protein